MNNQYLIGIDFSLNKPASCMTTTWEASVTIIFFAFFAHSLAILKCFSKLMVNSFASDSSRPVSLMITARSLLGRISGVTPSSSSSSVIMPPNDCLKKRINGLATAQIRLFFLFTGSISEFSLVAYFDDQCRHNLQITLIMDGFGHSPRFRQQCGGSLGHSRIIAGHRGSNRLRGYWWCVVARGCFWIN